MATDLMSKAELLKAVSEKSGLSAGDSGAVLDALSETIAEQVAAGRTVQLLGVGRISRRWREERTARNPRTNAEVKVPARHVPAISWASNFKSSIA
ncbi:MAG: HU family DNA-binding protein [Rhodobacteraceae bacterium]|nr:HU family DNA-binding protein [Paracoccaceae bacterium]